MICPPTSKSHFHERGDNVFHFFSLWSGNIFYKKKKKKKNVLTGCGLHRHFEHLLTDRTVEVIFGVECDLRELNHGGVKGVGIGV